MLLKSVSKKSKRLQRRSNDFYIELQKPAIAAGFFYG
jgi:hypothetical protein